MEIDPGELKDLTNREVLRRLIKDVTKVPEEAERKETRSGKQSVVKIFIADNKGLEPGDLHASIEKYINSDDIRKNEQEFFNNKVISENNVKSDISLLEISSPGVNRTDEFIVIFKDGYVWVLTTVVRKWTKNTVEKLLDYLPVVEKLYISPSDLEDIVTGVEDLGETTVSGFTAEYRSQHRNRDATLRFHGAEEGDLARVKDEFQATPSRIEFNQANSPVAAIQDSVSNDGLITVESVLQNSEDQAVETALHILDDYEQRDQENFEITEEPRREYSENGFKIDGYTAVELTDPEAVGSKNLREELEQKILSKHQYNYGEWADDGLFVLDKHHDEIFEIGIEGGDIVIFPRDSTSALSIRSFFNNVYDEFNSTYNVEKHTAKVSQK